MQTKCYLGKKLNVNILVNTQVEGLLTLSRTPRKLHAGGKEIIP